jgi:hypothetical protein
VTALALGCATVRTPAGRIAEPVPVRDGRAEPQVLIWVEDKHAVDPAAAARTADAAQAALAAAVAEQGALEGDAMLVVRAQGVTRTPSRRTDQKLAVAGMVVGAVVVVAVTIVAIVASRGKSGGSKPSAAKAPAAAPRPPAAAAPRGRPPAPRPAAAAGARPAAAPAPRLAPAAAPGGRGGPLPAPAPRLAGSRPAPAPAAAPWRGPYPAAPSYGGGWFLDFQVGLWLDATPYRGPYAAAEPPALLTEPPAADATPLPPADARVDAVSLRPPPPLALERRDFFSGDELLLELVIVDRRDGLPLWRKVARKSVDPTDAPAVRRAFGEALAEGEWLPASDVAALPR